MNDQATTRLGAPSYFFLSGGGSKIDEKLKISNSKNVVTWRMELPSSKRLKKLMTLFMEAPLQIRRRSTFESLRKPSVQWIFTFFAATCRVCNRDRNVTKVIPHKRFPIKLFSNLTKMSSMQPRTKFKILFTKIIINCIDTFFIEEMASKIPYSIPFSNGKLFCHVNSFAQSKKEASVEPVLLYHHSFVVLATMQHC